ncbi:MAG: transcription elongation factor GreB [Pseudomonadales bacterium]|nr:transcription elongation factor GreB [Pseudomonadales bacterium]MDP6471836.1 transcription elongation factor GreB [Pseudomonadales bacterium]MDP6828750.1 transcription elongation factor GreB [Pseudomonadales bacterium]MDP6970660.1 transcription elongation factor GreB [Pseudomonadales bacterium]
MSRYRPPRPASSPYITPAGKAKLEAELRYLWKEKRPEVTRKVSEAAAMGDRSENAEYIYGKKQLREIDARVRYLSKRLEVINVVTRLPSERDRVFFGAIIDLEDETGARHRYRLVGPDEFGDAPEYISIDSPMARALLKKRIGDAVEVNAAHYEIIALSYPAP